MRIVEVKGKDSAEFLHRVTAGSVKPVGLGEGRGGLLLTGQSKMIAQFELLHLAPGHYLLAAPDACAEALANGLEALHFSESLEIALTEKKVGVRELAGAAREEGKNFSVASDGRELSWPTPVPGYEFSSEAQGVSPSWDFDRIAALYPQPGDWTETTPALEAGMLPFIDRFKGCYPGQEVVELSLNVGHPVRVLVAVEAGEAIPASLDWGGAQVPATSVAERAGRFRALIRLPWAKREFLPSGFTRIKSHW